MFPYRPRSDPSHVRRSHSGRWVNLRRALFLTHRWAGIALCVFMALWFASGVVMMYVGYPKLNLQERMQGLPALDPATCCLPVAAALASASVGEVPQAVRLTSIGGRPHYVVRLARNRELAIDGHSGEPVTAVGAELALRSAAAFAPHAQARYRDSVDEDAWTHSKALDRHRPLHRVDVADEARTLLYVSGKTGEVVRDASATERHWGWVGAWLHWLYVFRGGVVDRWWTEIIICTSLAGAVLGFTGLVSGVLRWRRHPYPHGSRSPYRAWLMRWHHWLGLGFGLLLLSWVMSGLLSVNPWKVFDSQARRPQVPSLVLTAGNTADETQRSLRCFASAGIRVREMEWLSLGGERYVLGREGAESTRLLRADGDCLPFAAHDLDALRAAGERMLPNSQVGRSRVQTAYDWHYYDRAPSTMTGHVVRPLPVLVLEFDDPAESWLYLDPRTGGVVQVLDSHLRVKRWLFALLHSWDWKPLLDNRPLWDVLLILGSAGGLLISLSGAVLGWRRLGRGRASPPKSTA